MCIGFLGHVVPILDLQGNVRTLACTWTVTMLDCKWVRASVSKDSTYDVNLTPEVPRSMVFAFGTTMATVVAHTSFYVQTNVTLTRS